MDRGDAHTEVDVCVIGHVCRDRVQIGGQFAERPGGTAYYAPIALRRLERSCATITKLAAVDRTELLSELRSAGVALSVLESPRTTHFSNVYGEGDPDTRRQQASAVAAPFRAQDLNGARARVFHLGPLTAGDMDADFVAAVATRGTVSLDVQGLVRRVDAGAVSPAPWTHAAEGLKHVALVKADAAEARELVGERDPERAARAIAELGPREVIVTLGRHGSLVLCEGRAHRIRALAPRHLVDPTGCGDTYMAAYLHRRLAGAEPARAGEFAAAVATLALEVPGPFRGDAAQAQALLRARA